MFLKIFSLIFYNGAPLFVSKQVEKHFAKAGSLKCRSSETCEVLKCFSVKLEKLYGKELIIIINGIFSAIYYLYR